MKSYFTIDELCKSETARILKIDNTPSEEIKENLERLIELLNPIRELWGDAIIVSSGYRCPKLNDAVGGAKNSGHLSGLAVDIHPRDRRQLKDFYNFLKYYLQSREIMFDQLIFEHSKSSEWVHLSFNGGRCQAFNLTV